MDTLNLRQRILLNQPHIASVSGDIANFTTDMKAPLKECKVYFEPIQEGSGDPSPDNVRNITGWSGVEVTKCEKNLFDISKAVDGYVHYYGTSISIPDAKNMTSDFIPVCEGDVLSYQVYPTEEGKGYWTGYCFYGSKNMTDTVGIRKVAEGTTIINNIIVPTKAKYIRIGSRYLKGGSAQLELSTVITQYEQYQEEIKTISWVDQVGTVYGGYIDLVKGELTITHKSIVFTGEEDWTSYKTSDQIHFYLTLEDKKIAKNVSISNLFPNINNTTFWDNKVYSVFGDHPSLPRIYINAPYEMPNGATEWKEWLSANSLQVCYELAEPISYTLTSQQLLSFVGVNNIWSNSNGQTEVKFWTH